MLKDKEKTEFENEILSKIYIANASDDNIASVSDFMATIDMLAAKAIAILSELTGTDKEEAVKMHHEHVRSALSILYSNPTKKDN